MPAFDKTGPAGKGPMTGRGAGRCISGKKPLSKVIGRGRSRGKGRGRRGRFGPSGLMGPGYLRGPQGP